MNLGLFRVSRAFLLAALLACGCGGPPERPSPAGAPLQTEPTAAAPQHGPKQSSPELFDQWTEGVPPGLREAWQRLTANGRYCLARENDFRFSENAPPIVRVLDWPRHPYFRIFWNPKSGGDDRGFLAVIVDTTMTDDSRFGLVLLNAASNRKEVYEVHWVFRNRDLSKTYATTASSNLFVNTCNDDGSTTTCAISWDKRRKKYVCK